MLWDWERNTGGVWGFLRAARFFFFLLGCWEYGVMKVGVLVGLE